MSARIATHCYPMLYGHSTRGVVKIWNIRVESEERAHETAPACIIITHGQENGKQQETIVFVEVS